MDKGFLAVCVFLIFLDQTLAIKCYRCTVAPIPRLNKTMLCSKFNHTDYYVVDCPYSTMCLKKIFKYKLLDGQEVETVTRECAQQKNTVDVLKNGGYQKEHRIEEAYGEECVTEQKSMTGSTTFCHCRGNLCNSAKKETSSYHTDAMAVIFVFNAMKYLRSME